MEHLVCPNHYVVRSNVVWRMDPRTSLPTLLAGPAVTKCPSYLKGLVKGTLPKSNQPN